METRKIPYFKLIRGKKKKVVQRFEIKKMKKKTYSFAA